MSAERLRDAAKVLRDRAEKATPGPWAIVPGASNVWRFPDEGAPTLIVAGTGAARVQRRPTEARQSDAAYIATVHPGVGLALADWLDAQAKHIGMYYCATQCEPDGCDETKAALRLADLILGGTP